MSEYFKYVVSLGFTLLLCRYIIDLLDKKLQLQKLRLTDKCKYFVASTLCILLGVISGVFA